MFRLPSLRDATRTASLRSLRDAMQTRSVSQTDQGVAGLSVGVRSGQGAQ